MIIELGEFVNQGLRERSVIARSEKSERRDNPSTPQGRDRTIRFYYRLTVDRHGLNPRNDKSERIYHEGSEEFEVTSCHCEEGMKVSDGPIH